MLGTSLRGQFMRKRAAWLILGGLLAAQLFGQRAANVPQGSAVMIDGKLSPGEWSDAKEFPLSNGVDLFVKRHERFLLIAVEFPAGIYGFTDLFINRNLDLHASAKLGERARASNGEWSAWKWWNNDGWVANVSRVDEFAGPKLIAESVREYQIDLDRFSSREIQLEVLSTIMKDNRMQSEWRSAPLTLFVR
jgi:hypothetical protein